MQEFVNAYVDCDVPYEDALSLAIERDEETTIEREHHIERHKLLHKNFEELLADFIDKTGRFPSKVNLPEFLNWSYDQTTNPDTESAPVSI